MPRWRRRQRRRRSPMTRRPSRCAALLGHVVTLKRFACSLVIPGPATQTHHPQVTHGDVFVAERFGGWQEVALRALSRCFNDKNGGFSGDAFNVVNEELKAAATGGVDPALQVRGVGERT